METPHGVIIIEEAVAGPRLSPPFELKPLVPSHKSKPFFGAGKEYWYGGKDKISGKHLYNRLFIPANVGVIVWPSDDGGHMGLHINRGSTKWLHDVVEKLQEKPIEVVPHERAKVIETILAVDQPVVNKNQSKTALEFARKEIQKAVAARDAEWKSIFQVKLNEATKKLKDELAVKITHLEKLEQERSKKMQAITQEGVLSRSELQLIRGCLHADKHPHVDAEFKARLNSAFTAFSKLYDRS